MSVTLGLIGLGEAGLAIADGLRTEGVEVHGYDVRAGDPAVAERIREAGVVPRASTADLAGTCDVLIGLTTASTAKAVVGDLEDSLRPRHVFTDWNSGSPGLKRELAGMVSRTGARFADGAVMGAVPPARHRVPVLLSGDGAEALAATVEGLGFNLEVIGPEPGQASAVKMMRSLLIKGLEALLLEFVAGADRYGITERVLGSMDGALPVHDWGELASYLLTRSYTHGARRAEELRQVAATLASSGVEPVVASAGATRLQWLVDLGLDRSSPPPAHYRDVLELIKEAQAR
ncbi:DUF1932 domain-containing protein [Nonomuraea sp. B5E05]|uniref:DUF1932 domain-containing protein n=1 Tax=Nonomuraea sp. B5E05 TaxID=3153569 RepID=UPI003260CA00